NTGNHKDSAVHLKSFIYQLTRSLENRFMKVKPDALNPKKIDELVKGIPVMQVKPAMQDNMLIIPEKNIQEIRTKYQPDVCIKLGFENVSCYATTCATHGMWEHEFGISKPGKKPDAMVWDMIHGNCTTKISIRKYTGSNQYNELIYQ